MTPFDMLLSRLALDEQLKMLSPFEQAVIERLDHIHAVVRWIRIFLAAVILAVTALLVTNLQ